MWWRLLQLIIMGAVLCANAYYEWTPNGYLAAALGGGAAFLLTYAIQKIIDIYRYGWGAQVIAFRRWRKAAFSFSWTRE